MGKSKEYLEPESPFCSKCNCAIALCADKILLMTNNGMSYMFFHPNHSPKKRNLWENLKKSLLIISHF